MVDRKRADRETVAGRAVGNPVLCWIWYIYETMEIYKRIQISSNK